VARRASDGDRPHDPAARRDLEQLLRSVSGDPERASVGRRAARAGAGRHDDRLRRKTGGHPPPAAAVTRVSAVAPANSAACRMLGRRSFRSDDSTIGEWAPPRSGATTSSARPT
jgi:hypothetical protein